MTYLFLSSDDSLTYHPDNNSYDFTVELSRELKGAKRLALCELVFTPINEDLYVFCDVCDDSYALDRSLPLLRIVNASGEVSNLYFQDVTRSHVHRIRIYIRTKRLEIPSADIGTVRCTLVAETV